MLFNLHSELKHFETQVQYVQYVVMFLKLISLIFFIFLDRKI